MRYIFLLIGAALISSCSQGVGSTLPAGGLQNASMVPSGSGPSITKVTKIKAKQNQKIVISGSGFGTMNPYNGDSAYLQILDTTGGWSAGLLNGSQDDLVTLNVTKWSNKKIIIKGFTGDYGESYWTLKKGDSITINVWNAQDGSGPATITTTVQ